MAITHRARITSQGQITVPKRVRDELAVGPGDDLEFEMHRGSAVVRPRRRTSVLAFSGIAAGAAARVPRSASDIDRLIAQTKLAAAKRRSEPRRR